MKLRALALALLLANLGFFVWSQGWLDAVTGLRAGGDREPERAARQFQPQVLRVLPGAAGAAAMAGSAALAGAAPVCLEAGPFTAAEADAALARWRERGAPALRIVRRADGEAWLRIDEADAALAARLGAGGGDAAGLPPGKPFVPCAN